MDAIDLPLETYRFHKKPFQTTQEDIKVFEKSCKEFEAMFFKEIFDEMLKATPFGEEQEGEEEFAWSQLSDQLPMLITERGGIGFARHMMESVQHQFPQFKHSGEVQK